MKSEEYIRSVLIAGLIAGALSSVPFIGWLNICCCLWILLAGILAVYMVSSNLDKKIDYGQGAFIGLLSGLVAAVVSAILDSILAALGYDIIQHLAYRFSEFEKLRNLIYDAELGLINFIFDLCISIVFFGAFGALGGIIGTAIYSKKKAPVVQSKD
jgi:hypothetical protein